MDIYIYIYGYMDIMGFNNIKRGFFSGYHWDIFGNTLGI